MRTVALLVALAALTAPAGAQTPPPEAAACTARSAGLAGIGRASVVAFRGPVSGGAVCATVANFAQGAFTARLAGAPPTDAPADALAVAPAAATVAVAPSGDLTTTGGPYVIAPGGRLGEVADPAEAPRVVLAFAADRVLLLATSAVQLADLARVLRDQPDLFGADAVERAVVLASGPSATLLLRTDDGVWGVSPAADARVVVVTKR